MMSSPTHFEFNNKHEVDKYDTYTTDTELV